MLADQCCHLLKENDVRVGSNVDGLDMDSRVYIARTANPLNADKVLLRRKISAIPFDVKKR